jgi:hypothetical protein
MAAAFLEPGRFIEGRKIDEASAARLPRWAVGQVLRQPELAALAAGKKNRPPRVCGDAGRERHQVNRV